MLPTLSSSFVNYVLLCFYFGEIANNYIFLPLSPSFYLIFFFVFLFQCNISCWRKVWSHHFDGWFRNYASHQKMFICNVWVMVSSIHIPMEINSNDDHNKVIKEIYQGLVFGSQGLHWLIIASRYKIVREQLFKHI